MDRGELGELQVAEFGDEKIMDDLTVALGGFRGDFLSDRVEPGREPLPYSDSAWIDVFAGIERAKQTAQFLLGVFAGAADGCGGDAALTGRGIGAEAVADFP